MGPRHIDQFTAGFASGDAISREALLLQAFLRSRGFQSRIFSQHFSERESERVAHFTEYHRKRNALLIYHHSFYSDFLDDITRFPARKILIYHNTTPPEFVRPYNRLMAEQLAVTRASLHSLAPHFEAGLADSEFNAAELREHGFQNVRVMPVAMDFTNWNGGADQPAHLKFLRDGRKNVLFVGRVFPNKKHQDLLKAFYYFRKIVPDSRLILVGSFHPGVRGYSAELLNLARALGLADDVFFTGTVTGDEIRAYYRSADLFLSMSEHEGFFVPLVECMYFDIPIVAYTSSVIPETLGGSGVLFHDKDYPRVAEMMAAIVERPELREAILARQRERLRDFSLERTQQIFQDALAQLGVPM